MTLREFEMLCDGDVRRTIAENIERDPVSVALDKRIEHSPEVATQVKYLQRARRKLPSYFAAGCILPPLAFEQSSGEICAGRKPLAGDSVLDLTCGLGVDSFALSKRFRRVVAVERDEVTAAVARENFRRLGVDNVEVVCDTAEHYAATSEERFDWCFADPDRRGADGGKRVLVEDCSPDMNGIIPLLQGRGTAKRFCIKLSPMFDVAEARRIFQRFGRCSVEAVSLGDECKELLVVVDDGRESSVTAVAAGRGEFSVTTADMAAEPVAAGEFEPEKYGYLIVPDVALQKARLVRRYFGASAWTGSENGFAFAAERPSEDVLGRVFGIERIEPYDPTGIRRELKGRRCEILLRDTRLALPQIRRATGLREGADLRMAVTSAAGRIWAIRLK